MPDKIKYLKKKYMRRKKKYHFGILFFLVVGNLRKKILLKMLICAKHNRIIVENDELNKILRKIIDK